MVKILKDKKNVFTLNFNCFGQDVESFKTGVSNNFQPRVEG